MWVLLGVAVNPGAQQLAIPISMAVVVSGLLSHVSGGGVVATACGFSGGPPGPIFSKVIEKV